MTHVKAVDTESNVTMHITLRHSVAAADGGSAATTAAQRRDRAARRLAEGGASGVKLISGAGEALHSAKVVEYSIERTAPRTRPVASAGTPAAAKTAADANSYYGAQLRPELLSCSGLRGGSSGSSATSASVERAPIRVDKHMRVYLDVDGVHVDIHLCKPEARAGDEAVLSAVLGAINVVTDHTPTARDHFLLGALYMKQCLQQQEQQQEPPPQQQQQYAGASVLLQQQHDHRAQLLALPPPPQQQQQPAQQQQQQEEQLEGNRAAATLSRALQHFAAAYAAEVPLSRECRTLSAGEWAQLVHGYGALLSSSGDAECALCVFSAARDEAPRSPAARYAVACAHAELGDAVSALQELEAALSLQAQLPRRAQTQTPDPSRDLAFRNYWNHPQLQRLTQLYVTAESC
ncbi:hypothetical protein JKP88DRAFT_293655 [Tribonema minus]|uniref:Uncharacterized protein n=1 Tax=Tribonema minus TaxID=303371 RepID=A0A835ZJP9_9STRA|nr:hypothetical protein JKP88DRAFT_293655 [Tribonema minus]